MRHLASVRTVSKIQPIPGADAIEHLAVDGWWVVAKKGEFAVGDLAVYFEIDSWIPHDLAPFLSGGKAPKDFEGIPGARLRTVKLRGALSQGLLLPVSILPEELRVAGTDVTEHLGVQKWEPEVSLSLRGCAPKGSSAGSFPYGIPKTDLERVQNISHLPFGETFEVTLKLDGSSCTLLHDLDGKVRVFSRNIELDRESPHNSGNAFVAISNQLESAVQGLPLGWAIRGELMGPGIQGNREGFSHLKFFAFDIWDASGSDVPGYLPPGVTSDWCDKLGFEQTPLIDAGFVFNSEEHTRESLLQWAETFRSINHPIAEGIVFKHVLGDRAEMPLKRFKVISNLFLLKEK